MRKSFLAACIIITFISSGFSTHYYVKKSGSGSNDGSSTRPWLTIQKSAGSMAAGDTVTVENGNYREHVTSKESGGPDRPITFPAAAACTVKCFIIYHDYIRVEGFHFFGQTTPYQAMVYLAGNHVDILDNVLEHDTTAISVFGIRCAQYDPPESNGSPEDCRIEGNTFRYFMYIPLNVYGRRNLVEDNTFTTIWHDCIRVWGRDHAIRRNIFEDVGDKSEYDIEHEDIIQVFGNAGYTSMNVVFERNIIRNCTDAQIGMLSEGNVPTIREWTFRNNVFVNIGHMMSICMKRVRFYNNVFYNTTQNTSHPLNFAFDTDGVHGIADSCEVMNNIFLACGKDPNSTRSGWYSFDERLEGCKFDYNVVAGSAPNFGRKDSDPDDNPRFNLCEEHGINGGDPQFVDPAGMNFHLKKERPVHGAGINLFNQGINDDFDGIPRQAEGAWDCGAFVYSPENTDTVLRPVRPVTHQATGGSTPVRYTLSGKRLLRDGRRPAGGYVVRRGHNARVRLMTGR